MAVNVLIDRWLNELVEHDYRCAKEVLSCMALNKTALKHFYEFRDHNPAEFEALKCVKTLYRVADDMVAEGLDHQAVPALLAERPFQVEFRKEWGLQWYVDYFRNVDILDILKDLGLVVGSERELLATMFHGFPRGLMNALRNHGLLTSEPGRDWYLQACSSGEYIDSGTLYFALKDASLLTADAGHEWYGRALGADKEFLYRTLEECSLFTAAPGRDWYVEHFAHDGGKLLEALDLAGLRTAEPGLQWYLDAFPDAWAMRLVRVFQGMLDTQIPLEWFKETFDDDGDQMPLYYVLKDAGWLTRDRSYEWYASTFPCLVSEAIYTSKQIDELYPLPLAIVSLGDAGKLTREPGLAYYRALFEDLAEDFEEDWRLKFLEFLVSFDLLAEDDHMGVFEGFDGLQDRIDQALSSAQDKRAI
jgi:hypothetical protein